jgi:hypothetical protein
MSHRVRIQLARLITVLARRRTERAVLTRCAFELVWKFSAKTSSWETRRRKFMMDLTRFNARLPAIGEHEISSTTLYTLNVMASMISRAASAGGHYIRCVLMRWGRYGWIEGEIPERLEEIMEKRSTALRAYRAVLPDSWPIFIKSGCRDLLQIHPNKPFPSRSDRIESFCLVCSDMRVRILTQTMQTKQHEGA